METMGREKEKRRGGLFRYTKEAERTFFFYATVVMFFVWIYLRFTGA